MKEDHRRLTEILRSRAWEDRGHRRLRELAAKEIERLEDQLADCETALARHDFDQKRVSDYWARYSQPTGKREDAK